MKDKLCGIYCIENMLNNKKYIGLSRDIKRRWTQHKTKLRHHTHNNPYLQSAWDKNGEENFNFYILEICDEEKLSERECYYISFYKTLSHEAGYNLTTGGENTSIGKPIISLKDGIVYSSVRETIDKLGITYPTMSIWCKNKHNYMYLDEYNLLSNEEKEYWCNYDWETADHERLSKAHSKENLSEETLQKYSASLSGKNNPKAFAVYCPQLDEIFECAKYATDKYGINRGSIGQCIKGKLKSAGTHPVTGEKLTWEKV